LGWNDYGARNYDALLGRWLGVDALAEKYMGYNPYVYCLGNPVSLIDPNGQFPITPSFRENYPRLTNFIENKLQSYVLNSPRMTNILEQYSVGTLTKSQIQIDFQSKNGPSITNTTYSSEPGALNQEAEYDYNSNTMIFGDKELQNFEKKLGSSDKRVQSWGMMDFTKLFLHEYIHYGDALDGMDAVIDANGKIANDEYNREPCAPHCIFEEGKDGAGQIFPLGNGRQNFELFKRGNYTDPNTSKIYETDKSKIDETMIPKN
jgi:hypothetical protein